MPAPVVINFQVGGIAQVSQAFRTIEQALSAMERGGTQQAARASRERTSLALQETRAREREEKERTKAAEREAREKVRAYIKADREIERARKDAFRQMEVAERAANERALQWVRTREREETESARRVAAMRQRFLGAVGVAAGRGISQGISGVMGATRSVAGTVMQLGGGFSVADSVRKATEASGLAADIANSGLIPAGPGVRTENTTKKSTADILGAARGTAVEYGMDTQEALGGLQKFVGVSGDLHMGMQLLPQLAQLARATGSSLEDVAAAAGNVAMNLGDVDKDGSKTMAVLRGVAAQGKLGAVEMRDLASQMAKLTAAAGQFSGDEVQNILMMGVLAQEARGKGGAASPQMAATAVAGFVNTLKTPARIAQFKERGIDVFDPTTKLLKDPRQIILQSLEKTQGDPEAMKKMFANVMGERAVTGFANIYRKGEAEQKGSGKAKVEAEFARLSGVMTSQDVARAASDRMRESDAQMAKVMAEFDRAVAEKLVPKLLDMVPVIEKLIPIFIDLNAQALPQFVDLIKTLADVVGAHKDLIHDIASHPIGAIMAFEVTKSIGQAALGEAIKSVLLRTIGGAGGGAPGALGAGVGAAGALTAVGATAAVAGLAVGGKGAIDAYMAGGAAGQKKAGELTSDVIAGRVSPEEAQKLIEEAKGRTGVLGTAKTALGAQTAITDQLLGAVGLGQFGTGSEKRLAQDAADRELVNSDRLRKAIEDAVVRGLAGGLAKADPSAAARNAPQSSPLRGGTN